MRFIRAAVAVALVAAAATSCSNDRGYGDPTNGRPNAPQSWRRLPDAPLTPRDHAVVVGVDERMLVVGGWEFLCPPMADCSTPGAPLLDDGAVYDRTADSWRTMAPPPFGVRRQDYATAALDGSAYLLTGCADGPMCDAQPRLLSYDPAGDRWTDHGPVPGPEHDRHLTTIGRTLLVYSGKGPVLNGHFIDSAGWILDPGTWTWTVLPAHDGEHQDLSGALDRERATYDIPNSVGQMASAMRLFVYDSVTETLVAIPAPPGREDVYDDSSTALGRDLFVFGGQRWTDDGPTGNGELVGDAWLWAAPIH